MDLRVVDLDLVTEAAEEQLARYCAGKVYAGALEAGIITRDELRLICLYDRAMANASYHIDEERVRPGYLRRQAFIAVASILGRNPLEIAKERRRIQSAFTEYVMSAVRSTGGMPHTTIQ